LPHRHPGNNVINQVSSRLRHAPPTARGTESTPLAGKGHQFLMGAVGTTLIDITKRLRQTCDEV